MLVRPKKRPSMEKAGGQPIPKVEAEQHTFPAPTRGWILNENLAQVQPASASILDNYICTTTGVRPRGGCLKYADIGSEVTAAFTYKSGASAKFFAANASAIYDISIIADPDVTPTAAVSGQTSGDWYSVQFGTVATDYLIAVNGSDEMQQFDGTSWQAINAGSTPAITGVLTSVLSHVWSYANRVFLVEGGTMSAWYLPVDSVGGAALEFSLAGIFKRGGSLLFGATWSLDAGDGLDDKCVFFSSEGEVAVYEGTDPSDASNWRKVGVYYITRPTGPNAIMQAGGDLVVATEAGVVPISEAIRRDSASLEVNAFSAQIASYWRDRSAALAATPWEIIKWPEAKIMVVSQPSNVDDTCLVANLDTGAWSRITGWNTRVLGYYNGQGYFGDKDGNIFAMEVGGSDDGLPYTSIYMGQHETLGVGLRQKDVKQARAIFKSETPILPKVSAQVNYDKTTSTPPNSPANFTTSNWDEATWDEATWDGSGSVSYTFDWSSVGRSGFVVAPEVLMTFGTTPAPRAELVSVDVTFDVGSVVN